MREALRLLASQHLIITTRGVAGGSFVVHPSPAQLSETIATGLSLMQASSLVRLDDIIEARAIVEVPATGLAARRRTAEDLEALQATLFDPSEAEFDVMMVAHLRFHAAIADACGNPLLALVTKPLHSVANFHEVLRRFAPAFWAEVDRDHRAILAAVLSGDAAEAEATAALHLTNLRDAIIAGRESPDGREGEPAVSASAAV